MSEYAKVVPLSVNDLSGFALSVDGLVRNWGFWLSTVEPQKLADALNAAYAAGMRDAAKIAGGQFSATQERKYCQGWADARNQIVAQIERELPAPPEVSR